ncbi:MAG: hypothetical protein WBN70_13620 [Polyangiales bacterium]|jgi:hypothetical protein
MPSLARAADLERVLTRAAEECESGAAWFGQGLPQALKNAIAATGKPIEQSAAEVAFVEAGAAPTVPPSPAARVVALSTEGLEELASVVRSVQGSKPRVARLICPVAVLDFTTEGIRVREIRHGLTAADLQGKLSTTLWSGPDLKELGSH